MLAGVGVAAGFLSALFGVGGGVIVVPALVLLLGFDPKTATGDLARSDRRHRARRGVLLLPLRPRPLELGSARRVFLPSFGSIAGVHLQKRISSTALTRLFALFIVAIAVILFLE